MPSLNEILQGAIGLFTAKPERAAMTSTVSCSLIGPTRTSVRCGGHVIVTDEPRYAGGEDAGPAPADMALMAAASCAAVAVRYWSTLLDIPFDSLDIELEGDLDKRGALGFDGVRPGFTDVRLTFDIRGPASREDYGRLLERSSDACPVSDMLRNPVRVTNTLKGG